MGPLTFALVAAGWSIAGWLAGWLAAGRRRRTGRPEAPICGCSHHRALHDPTTGRCHDTVLQPGYDLIVGHFEKTAACACRQYVGPIPITEIWTPPIALPAEDER